MQNFLANISSPFSAAYSVFYSVYIVDFIDILIIGILMYAALILFKNTKSFFILIGILMFAGLYIAAIIFNLYLTSIALQGFFGAFLVILVILFQQELRRFLEFAATRWRTILTKQKNHSIISRNLEAVIQAVSNLAHQKIGALIVFEGREPLGRYFTNEGIKLDGIISEFLLESLFDPSSPGHDGAVIISNDKISAFAVHLPLSPNIKEFGKYGTRHTAAAGISEKTDCLAIVVSEERGIVSAALEGKLKQFQHIEQLEVVLNKFFKEKFPEKRKGFIEVWLKRNYKEKITAFIAAVGLWFFLVYQAETIQRVFLVPVEYRNLSVDLLIENSKPNEVNLTLAGRSQVFNIFDPKTLAISIDALKISQMGFQTVAITEDLIRHPKNTKVVDVKPDKVAFSAAKFVLKELPIQPKIEGKPAKGYSVSRVEVLPSSLRFFIPENEVNKEMSVATESLDISGATKDIFFSSRLNLPSNIRLGGKEPATAQVSVFLKKSY